MIEAPIEKQAIAAIADDYGMGRVVSVAPAPIGWSGRMNHQLNLLVDSGRGKSILRFDEGRGELDVKREIDLLLYLRKHSFPCPQPLADRKSRHYRDVGGACLIAYKHIDGRAPKVERLTMAQIESVGRALADLHVIADHAIGADRDVLCEVRARMDYRAWVDIPTHSATP